MAEKQKVDLKEKEQKLLAKIEKAKNELSRLQERRRLEIGKLACKYGLDALDNVILEQHFSKLAKKIPDGS